jgi:hypothetical protein
VVSPNDATLEDRPKSLNRIGVDSANDMLANGMIDRLMWETVFRAAVARIRVGAEQADTVRYGLAHEGLKGISISPLNNASNDIALALDRTNNGSLASVAAPASTAFLVPMPVLVASADVGFINLNDSAKLLDILDHSSSDLVAHEPSSLVGAEAHIAEDLEGAHALLADEHKVGDSVPIFQRLIRVLKDCAGQVREAITCGAARSAHGALPMVAGGECIDLGVTATWASYALRPAPRHKVNDAIIFGLKQRVELGRCHLVNCFGAGHRGIPHFLRGI